MIKNFKFLLQEINQLQMNEQKNILKTSLCDYQFIAA